MKTICLLLLALCAGSAAYAQTNSTWVSLTGNDNAACTIQAPCRTFGVAVMNTPAGGEVHATGPGDYCGGLVQQIVIGGSITIDGGGPGVVCAVTQFLSPVLINAASGSSIIIRNLVLTTIASSSSTAAAVDFQSALTSTTVTLENLVLKTTQHATGAVHLLGDGASKVILSNVTVDGGAPVGLYLGASTINTPMQVVVDHVTVTGLTSGRGIGLLLDTANASVRNSTFSGNNIGIETEDGTTALLDTVTMALNSQYGLQDLSGTVRIGNSTITGNGTGVSAAAGAQIISFRTNMLAGNVTDGTIVLSTSLK
jgi:hypothetical protein